MRWIRDVIYAIAIVVLWPWLVFRAVVQGKNRRGWRQKLLGWVPHRGGDRTCVWLHAVSVGEVLVLTKLARAIRQRDPRVDLVVSTTTETGFDLARSRLDDMPVFFWPLDFSWAVRTALKRIRPDLVVLTELELWPNMIEACHRQQIPVAVINGRMGQRSFRQYRRWRRLTGFLFRHLDLVLVQTEAYQKRLIELGTPAERVSVAGNIKFDGVETDRGNARTNQIRQRLGIAAQHHVWVAGSTQEEEDQMAVRVWQRVRRTDACLRLVLVPRHIDRVGRLVKWIRSQGERVVLWSDGNSAELECWRSGDAVLVVDVIGMLADLWGIADSAYVGGSMGQRGGQNMIEPAAFGAPVAFGPNVWNFRDVANSLIGRDAARMVVDESELESFVCWTMTDQVEAKRMGARAQDWVMSQQGALQRTVDAVWGLLREKSPGAIEPGMNCDVHVAVENREARRGDAA